MNNSELLYTVLIAAAVTAGLRFAPFILFSGKKEPPAFISWLGKKLPRAVMAMLVIYCLKDVNFAAASTFAPAIAGIAATVALHVAKRQMMLSIAGGTLVYMILSRVII